MLNDRNYKVFPRMVRCGREETVSICPMGRCARFDDSAEYTVLLVPCDQSERTLVGDDIPDDYAAEGRLSVRPHDGVLSFRYTFVGEQQWVILVSSEHESERHFTVYALEDDLYRRTPYMGDLHAHSCRSDGQEDPAVVAANYRKAGFDFMGITDHSKWRPSVEAIDAYRDAPIDLLMFTGEELHFKGHYIHVVNFGSRYSVNELYFANEEKIHAELVRESEEIQVPSGVNALEYCYRKWIYEEIKKSGGFCIVPHPHWYAGYQYNMHDRILHYVFETGLYDAFELLGGQTVHENNLQIGFYIDQCLEGRRLPIVGSSDSHGTDPACWFKQSKTIVFAEELTHESVLGAISDFYSVAVDSMPGEEVRVYGSMRLVKYGRFLLDYYFPEHDELCFSEGRAMRNYVCGEAGALDELGRLRGRTAAYADRSFGR